MIYFRVLILIWCTTLSAVSIYWISNGTGLTPMHWFNLIVNVIVGGFTVNGAYAEHKTLNGLSLRKRWQLAKTLIEQVKAGEWIPELYQYTPQNKIYRLSRKGQSMWVSNGAPYLHINDTDILGCTLRHYVWHKAVKQVVKETNDQFVVHLKHEDITSRILGEKPTLKVVK